MSWLAYALISAVAASATAILAKIGVEGVPSTLATAIRMLVIGPLVWMLVWALGEQRMIPSLSTRTVVFLALSGLATGISWLAYFRAVQLAPVSAVAPIDKLSLAFTVVLAAALLGEAISVRMALGVALMIAGALLTRG